LRKIRAKFRRGNSLLRRERRINSEDREIEIKTSEERHKACTLKRREEGERKKSERKFAK
jgi:hypothetical protein